MNFSKNVFILGVASILLWAYEKEVPLPPSDDPDYPDLVNAPTPYQLNIPAFFPKMEVPAAPRTIRHIKYKYPSLPQLE